MTQEKTIDKRLKKAMQAAGVNTHENALARALEFAKRTGDTTLEDNVKEKLTSENLYHLNGLTERMKNLFRLHHPAYKKDDLEIKTEKELEVGKEYAGVTDKINLLRKYFKIATPKRDDKFLEKAKVGDKLLYENLIKQVYGVEKEVKKYETQGQYDTALKDLQSILEMHPDKERIENKIAQVQNKRKLKDEFERYFVRGNEICNEIIEEKDYHERLNKFENFAKKYGFTKVKKENNVVVFAKTIKKLIDADGYIIYSSELFEQKIDADYKIRVLAFNGNRIIHETTDLNAPCRWTGAGLASWPTEFYDIREAKVEYKADSNKITIIPKYFQQYGEAYWFDN